ncbi:MAG: hypothetical protein ACI9EF_002844, partial [Pseudohongiellaceae bacterium]
MQRLALAWGLLVCLSSCADSPSAPLPTDGSRPLGWVDVLVATGEQIELSCAGDYLVTDDMGSTLDSRNDLVSGSALSLRAGAVHLAGALLGLAPLELRPQNGSVLSCAGVRYRGLLRIEVHIEGSQSKLRVLNRVHVDDYLKGVVPDEMPDRFGLEALAAQAVAARSYALAEIGRRGWLFADQRSQVYGGLAAETHIASAAIEMTSNQVLSSQGAVVTAWFHSTCGGATSPARLAFSYPPEGIFETAVACPDCVHSPTFAWERSVPGTQVAVALGLPAEPL